MFVWEVFNCGKIPYDDLLNQSLLEKVLMRIQYNYNKISVYKTAIFRSYIL